MIGLLENLHIVQYAILLTEAARADFLLKTYGERLTARWTETAQHESPELASEISREPGKTEGEKLLNYFLGHDPSRNQAYTQWMVNKYLKGGLRIEDLSRAASYLEVFDRAKSRIKPSDINAYKDLQALQIAVTPFIEQGVAVSARDENARLDRRMRQEDQSTVLLDSDTMKVLVPHTREAAIYFGRNTQWCTAATNSYNYYESYAERGQLYIILEKKTNRRWQWHFEDEMFMDEQDIQMGRNGPPTFIDFVKSHPEVMKAIGESRFIPWAVEIGLD
ncbi:MAG: hypothetical protein EOP83_12825, partial [Verrucomicrobiaceae bacterium]